MQPETQYIQNSLLSSKHTHRSKWCTFQKLFTHWRHCWRTLRALDFVISGYCCRLI